MNKVVKATKGNKVEKATKGNKVEIGVKKQRSKNPFRLPEFHYMIPVRYDSAFRSGVENDRLRKAHSAVKSIHVKPRADAVKSPNGTQMVKLTIAAPNKKLADACFADGNSVVREKMKKNSRKGMRSGQAMRSGPKKSKKSYVRRTYNRSKKNVKVVSPVENTRPMLVYPEPVTGSTDWGEYIERFDKYQKNNPNFKVV